MDYEREKAREWQSIGAVRESITRFEPPKLGYFERDTNARTQWRAGEPPAETIELPRQFVPIDIGPKRGRSRGRTDSPAIAVPQLQRIAQETSTEIIPRLKKAGFRSDVMVSIWGTLPNAKQAKTRIQDWKSSYVPEKPNASSRWGKVNSVGTPEQRDEYERRFRAQEEKEQFLRDPKPNLLFGASGFFEWDPDYDTPEEVLGAHLEACDPLRMEYSCYIQSQPGQKKLHVMGNDPENIKQVLVRLRGCVFQAVARGRINHLPIIHLFRPVSHHRLSSSVNFQQANSQGLPPMSWERPVGVKPSLEPVGASDMDVVERVQAARPLPKGDSKRFTNAVKKAFSTAKYFRGNLQMRATFGTFLLQRFRGNIQDVEEFEIMMGEDQVEGGVSDVALKDNVLDSFVQHEMFLHPLDQTQTRVQPEPSYSGSFLMKHKKDIADLRLDVDFSYDTKTKDIGTPTQRWSRYIYTPDHPVRLLNACLIDLENDSKAWAIVIDATESIASTSKTPELEEFRNRVVFDPENRDTDRRFIKFTAVPGLVLASFVQKKTWTFEITQSGYYVDVIKAQEHHLRNPESPRPVQDDLVAQKPTWRVVVYRKTWSTKLAATANLGVGQGIAEELKLADFFPSEDESQTGADIEHFFNILSEVQAVMFSNDAVVCA